MISYNVPGLVDSVKNNTSDFIIPNNNRIVFARVLTRLLLDESLRKRISTSAKEWSTHFDWDASALEMNELICSTREENKEDMKRSVILRDQYQK